MRPRILLLFLCRFCLCITTLHVLINELSVFLIHKLVLYKLVASLIVLWEHGRIAGSRCLCKGDPGPTLTRQCKLEISVVALASASTTPCSPTTTTIPQPSQPCGFHQNLSKNGECIKHLVLVLEYSQCT